MAVDSNSQIFHLLSIRKRHTDAPRVHSPTLCKPRQTFAIVGPSKEPAHNIDCNKVHIKEEGEYHESYCAHMQLQILRIQSAEYNIYYKPNSRECRVQQHVAT
jgi:hypothetical protein